jgi:hypothetical protein
MGTLEKAEKGIKLSFLEEEVKDLGLDAALVYRIHAATDGVWVLTVQEMPAQTEKDISETETAKTHTPQETGTENVSAAAQLPQETAKNVPETKEFSPPSEEKTPSFSELQADAKLFDLLSKKNLSDRVEGKFEQELNEAEQQRLQQLIAEGKIVKFKLNETYKKAVYQLAPLKKKESEKEGMPAKEIERYSLEKDGFLVVRNEERVKRLSHELEKQIKDKTVRGTKSFDGNFYIIEAHLLEKYREHACAALTGENGTQLSEVADALKISNTLARIICEFLKEDGDIIEKRKELYQVV